MAPVNATNVIEISSDEEDSAVKRMQKPKPDGQKPMQSHNGQSPPSSHTAILADRVYPNAGKIPVRCQSISTVHTKANHELPQRRASSEPGTSKVASAVITELPLNPLKAIADENLPSHLKGPGNASTTTHNSATITTQDPVSLPPKMTPSQQPEQTSTLPPTRKRKPTSPAADPATKRAKPTPALPPSPHPPEQPSEPTVSNIDLWSVPQYQEPITINDDAPPPPSAPKPKPKPKPTPPIPKTRTPPSNPPPQNPPQPPPPPPNPPSSTITSTTSTTTSPPTRPRPRPRRTMWTCAQLANFATALDTALDIDGFAAANDKTARQVRETLGFLVLGPIFAYAEEGQKIARRFHREMRGRVREGERVMGRVHRRERREGHWGAEGMEGKGGKGGKGLLEGAVGGERGGEMGEKGGKGMEKEKGVRGASGA